MGTNVNFLGVFGTFFAPSFLIDFSLFFNDRFNAPTSKSSDCCYEKCIFLRFSTFGTVLKSACKVDSTTDGFSGRKSRTINQNLFRNRMVFLTCIFNGFWLNFGLSWGRFERSTSAQHGLSRGQLEPTWANLRPTWGQLGPTWVKFGLTWGHLGTNLVPT